MPTWETPWFMGTALVSLFPHYCPLQRPQNKSCPRQVPKGVVGLESGSLIISPTAGGYAGIDEYWCAIKCTKCAESHFRAILMLHYSPLYGKYIHRSSLLG